MSAITQSLYIALVEATRYYRFVVPSQRGRWRLLKLLRKFEPRDFGPHNITRHGKQWHITNLKNHIEAALFYDLPYDPDTASLIDHWVHAGDHIIDVGANIGFFTTRFAALVGPSGTVLAFEPSPLHNATLQHNVKLQNCTNVTIYTTAMSDAESECIHFTTESSGSIVSDFAQYGQKSLATTQVRTRRLDDFLSDDQKSRITFIKVDVDGNDLAVFRGAVEILRKSTPHLLIEVAERTLAAAGCSPGDLLDFIRELGYMFLLSNGEFTDCTAAVIQDVNRQAVYADVLCVHEGKLPQPVQSAEPRGITHESS